MDDAISWKIEDIVTATGGECQCGDRRRVFSGVGIDSRQVVDKTLFVAIKGDKHDGHDYLQEVAEKGAGGVVVETGRVRAALEKMEAAGLACITVKDTLVALGDLARYQRRRVTLPIVAITGTNGKTTTKEMTALVCAQRFNVLATAGNYNNAIGLPLTLLRLDRSHQIGILEMGMNAPGEIAYLTKICEPDIGVILNVGSGHLAGVGSVGGVARAKGELLDSLGKSGTAIINADDARVMGLAKKAKGQVITFGVSEKADVRATGINNTPAGLIFDLQLPGAGECQGVRLPAFGKYMVTNALAAAAIGDLLGVSGPQIKTGLESFAPAPGRMNIMETDRGFYLIDDTYNANPGSVEAAISGLGALKGDSRAFLVLGDMYELGAYTETMHEEVGALAASAGLEAIYAAGEFAEAVKKGALSKGMAETKIVIASKDDIAGILTEKVAPGDWILIKGSRGMGMETVVAAMKAYGGKTDDNGRT